MNRLLVLILALALAGCAGRTATVPDVVAWSPEAEFDTEYFVSFHTVVEDTVPSPAALPAAGTCEGLYYVTGEGDTVALWLATAGTWVQVTGR
jgi:hypothetical protein